jgi:hypothetical protein
VGTVEKVFMGIIGVAMITTLILPGRQTPAVINSVWGGFSGALGTAMAR